MTRHTIHRHAAGPGGALVNAYLVEGEAGVVAVDGTLTVPDGQAVKQRLEALGKPLLAVLITHSHPDHYGGVGELVGSAELPIVAVEGVDDVIRRDDEIKEGILRPMFGDAWPRRRTFPNQRVRDGDTLDFGGLRFTAIDLGPAESPHDSAWTLGDMRTVFLGDQVYNHMHAYLADGHHAEWLKNLDRLRDLPEDATLYAGHGAPTSPRLLDWQRGYIEAFLAAIAAADFSHPESAHAHVVARMTDYLPSEDLRFLMELSIEPVAATRNYS
jgi:glyoxylase-like metal-dependent hydrolase (beta-lactamase superfamily II)